jgi:hypothetical protein
MPKMRILWDLFTSARGPLPTERDLRLDFFRGLALFSIFICHIPGNILAWFTLQAVMCADAAEVFVFVSGFTAGTVYSRTMRRKTSRYIDYFIGTPDFFQEPGVALARVLSLQFQPGFIDILPLYIVCLGFLPVVLAGFRFRPGLVILTSLSLWVTVQLDGRIAPPAWPSAATWGFNPFAWQALFYLGTWLGWRGNQPEVFYLGR